MDTFYNFFNDVITSLKYCNIEKEFYPFRDKIYEREEPKIFTRMPNIEYDKKFEISKPTNFKYPSEQEMIDEIEQENKNIETLLKLENNKKNINKFNNQEFNDNNNENNDKNNENNENNDDDNEYNSSMEYDGYDCETCDENDELSDKCYMGDSLPYPKRTKKELDDEMAEYWSRDIL